MNSHTSPDDLLINKVTVPNEFDKIARYYNLATFLNQGYQKDLQRSVNRMQLKGDEYVADLCCGTGGLALIYASTGVIATGIDIDPRVIRVAQQKKERLATPLSGWLPCRQMTVEQLTLGNISINDAPIHVIADDNPFGWNEFTLGTGFFKETVIVLDFERNILWVKNPLQSSSF